MKVRPIGRFDKVIEYKTHQERPQKYVSPTEPAAFGSRPFYQYAVEILRWALVDPVRDHKELRAVL
jgi:hypothetical protein